MIRRSLLVFFLNLLIFLSISTSAYSVLQPKFLYVGANSASNPTSIALIVTNNRVGISLTNPSIPLSVVTTGSELTGSAMSSTFRTQAGPLGTTAGSELALASIGFSSSNYIALGIRALRANAGSDWYSSVIGLGMDVDNTVRAGGNFFLASQNIGIGTSTPRYTLEVNGSMKSTQWNITEVMSNQEVSGSGINHSTLSTNTFTTQGGTLLIFASGTAYRTDTTTITVTVSIANSSGVDQYSLGNLVTYTNESSSHKVLVPRTFVKTGVAAGTYYIKFLSNGVTYQNSNDYLNCTVTELPL